jgi:hypothetical protein
VDSKAGGERGTRKRYYPTDTAVELGRACKAKKRAVTEGEVVSHHRYISGGGRPSSAVYLGTLVLLYLLPFTTSSTTRLTSPSPWYLTSSITRSKVLR